MEMRSSSSNSSGRFRMKALKNRGLGPTLFFLLSVSSFLTPLPPTLTPSAAMRLELLSIELLKRQSDALLTSISLWRTKVLIS